MLYIYRTMSYKISRNLEYALMALSYMSQANGYVSAREMTQKLACPFHPFSRVLQKLVEKKFIESRQGIQGGYILTYDLKELSLYQLMLAVLPPLEIAACFSGSCDLLEYCNIRNPVHYLNKKFLEFYKSLNVQEVLNCGQTKNPPPSNVFVANIINKNFKTQSME